MAASTVPPTMAAAVLTGHGGLDKLEYRTDVPVPQPGRGEVLIAVGAAGVNNTDINTRLGWYSKRVETGTDEASGETDEKDASWSGTPLTFPRIQGADVAGRIVAVGAGVAPARVGQRAVVRNMLRHYVDYRPFECWTLGSECDGGFAGYVVAPDEETHAISDKCTWTDAQLAAVPCAYSTAENMLHRAHVRSRESVLVTGASGGVGLAAVQLARRRGAEVIAIAAESKADAVRAAGASRVIDRSADLAIELGKDAVDVVLDVVGGPAVPALLGALRRGGRYAVAGAIGGPITEIDLRTIYLRDLGLFGCTFQDDEVFANLVGYVERDEIRPLVSQTYPLSEIRAAQRDFMEKKYPGKLVLLPPQGLGSVGVCMQR